MAGLSVREWVLSGGALAVAVGIVGYLAVHEIDEVGESIKRLDGAIATLGTKVDSLQTQFGGNQAAVASLNTSGTQLRDDIHDTRIATDDNGRKLDTVIADLAFVKGQINGMQGQLGELSHQLMQGLANHKDEPR
jgi:chromosome segregation ATPase